MPCRAVAISACPDARHLEAGSASKIDVWRRIGVINGDETQIAAWRRGDGRAGARFAHKGLSASLAQAP